MVYKNPEEAKKYAKNYREQNKDKISRYHERYNLKLKTDVFTHYSKKLSNSDVPCCSCCGENEFLIFLSLDHVTNRKNVIHKKGLAGPGLYRWVQKKGYPPEYQVLCINCNSAKSDSGICPHKKSGE